MRYQPLTLITLLGVTLLLAATTACDRGTRQQPDAPIANTPVTSAPSTPGAAAADTTTHDATPPAAHYETPPQTALEASSIEEAMAAFRPAGETITLTEEVWKSALSPNEFNILRKESTERAGTGDLLKNKDAGIYTCRGCGAPLFASTTKFESGTGWPSFWEPIEPNRVTEHRDMSYGMIRTEVECARCAGHLGHVFDDGPKPTGLRYCINAASLDFVKVAAAQ